MLFFHYNALNRPMFKTVQGKALIHSILLMLMGRGLVVFFLLFFSKAEEVGRGERGGGRGLSVSRWFGMDFVGERICWRGLFFFTYTYVCMKDLFLFIYED